MKQDLAKKQKNHVNFLAAALEDSEDIAPGTAGTAAVAEKAAAAAA
jgi:hypothetical protein